MHSKVLEINKTANHWLIFFTILILTQLLTCNMEKNTSSNPCKIYLRHDQRASDIGAHNSEDVAIYAYNWVQEGLTQLSQHLQGTRFSVFESKGPLLTFSIDSNMTLTELQKISRNEEQNVSGVINWSLYHDGGLNDTKILLAMKDLVRQSILVGRDVATHYGGYPHHSSRTELKPNLPVYVCDLAGLQFQREYNTGRLVLIYDRKETSKTIGLLDDFIFEGVVGEKRKSYQEANLDTSGRYISRRGFHNVPCLFDVYAYQKFVIGDVILAGLAIADMASKHGDKVVFKFLKYGTGFFAGQFSPETIANILPAVVTGLETLFEQHGAKVGGVIRHVEFPFYKMETESKARMDAIREKYSITYSFSMDDALKPTHEGLVVATTNCGDSMAVMGNEMGWSSVDASIAENLASKAAIFCPLLNNKINTIFI